MPKDDRSVRTIDARPLPPPQRHALIFKAFDEMELGETLLVVNDHEPVHLLQFMKHERRDFSVPCYTTASKDFGRRKPKFHMNIHVSPGPLLFELPSL